VSGTCSIIANVNDRLDDLKAMYIFQDVANNAFERSDTPIRDPDDEEIELLFAVVRDNLATVSLPLLVPLAIC